MTTTMIDRVYKQLRNKTKSPGITVARLADRARVPKETIRKIVYDLRQEGATIYTNYKIMRNGDRKAYYRLAA